MRNALAVAAAAAVTFGLVLVAGLLVVPHEDASGSSPKRTIYSFVYALKHHNYGRACSYEAQSVKAAPYDMVCGTGYTYNVAFGMVLGGVDAFAGIRVKPGSEECPDENTCTYVIDDPTEVIGAVKVTVVRQDSGRWRIEKIG